jgi:hypothetical protein
MARNATSVKRSAPKGIRSTWPTPGMGRLEIESAKHADAAVSGPAVLE